MKIIMISRDPKVLDASSEVYKRVSEYKTLFEELHIVLIRKNIFSFLNAFISASQFAKKIGRGGWITSQDPFEAGIVAFFVAKIWGLKLQFQLHTDCFNPMYRRHSVGNMLRSLLARILLPFADSVRIVSQRIKESLPQVKGKVYVLPIFVDVEKIQCQSPSFDFHKKYPEFEKIVLVMARLEREKNIGMALEAFAKILRKMPRVGLVVAGKGSEEKWIHKLLKHLQIENSTCFEGWLADPAACKGADLLLVTSFYEGYGMSIIEALASGCPVVSTDVGIAREAGATIANYDPGEIALKSLDILEKGVKGKLSDGFANISKQEYLQKFKETFQ